MSPVHFCLYQWENHALTTEKEYLSKNSPAVNDWLCTFSILVLDICCKQCKLNVCPYKYFKPLINKAFMAFLE